MHQHLACVASRLQRATSSSPPGGAPGTVHAAVYLPDPPAGGEARALRLTATANMLCATAYVSSVHGDGVAGWEV